MTRLYNHIMLLGREYSGDSLLKATGPSVFKNAYLEGDAATKLQLNDGGHQVSVEVGATLRYILDQSSIDFNKALISVAAKKPMKTLLLYVSYSNFGDNAWLQSLYDVYYSYHAAAKDASMRTILLIDKSNFSTTDRNHRHDQQFEVNKKLFENSGVDILEFDSRKEGARAELATFLSSEDQIQAALVAKQQAQLVEQSEPAATPAAAPAGASATPAAPAGGAAFFAISQPTTSLRKAFKEALQCYFSEAFRMSFDKPFA